MKVVGFLMPIGKSDLLDLRVFGDRSLWPEMKACMALVLPRSLSMAV